MTSNPISMIQQKVQNDFDALLAMVQGPAAGQQTADQMERQLFKKLLQLGAQLMLLFLVCRSRRFPREALVKAQGEAIPYHSERKRIYYSIFGKVDFERPYFYRKGTGHLPLDADLGLGEERYSDFLREMYEELNAYLPYGKTGQLLGRLLGINLSQRVQQQLVGTDAAEVAAYYQQQAAPPVSEEATILVAQADGKGVPIVRPSKNQEKVRLRRGEARSRKKAVVVTALYTIVPAPRTGAQVLQTLLQPETEQAGTASPARSQPQHKQIRGTLQGKDVALQRLAQQVAKRDGAHIQQRVALCDGERLLQEKLRHYLPGFTLVLDFIHAFEYLWKAANCLYGENHPQRLPWVTTQTSRLLNSQSAELIAHLRQLAEAPKRAAARRHKLNKIADYYENNLPYMDYAAYLAQGWPIASGVIEGACRHFVKDRMELSGMRWTVAGAENLLGLRAVAENDDWDDYHLFRKQQRQQRLYGCAWPASEPAFFLPDTWSDTWPAPPPQLPRPQPVAVPTDYERLPLVA